MSLIITYISKHGIVHASDSNLTNKTDTTEGKKTFDIPYLKAGLTYSGDYHIDGKTADAFISEFITEQKNNPDITIKLFASELMDRIQRNIRQEEIKGGIIIHIAGFIEINSLSYPTFYHISNVGLQEDGNYSKPVAEFHSSEDFLERDCPKYNLLKIFHVDDRIYQIYVNGYPPGRISYMALRHVLHSALSLIWSNPAWKFRPPCDIEESKAFVELYMRFMNILFQSSDFNLKYIGGPPQVLAIASPDNLSEDCCNST